MLLSLHTMVKRAMLSLLLAAGCQLSSQATLASDVQTLPIVSKLVAQAPAIAQRNDRVSIQTKTATFIRGKKGQDYPDYKEAVIKYPQVVGLQDRAISQRVQAAISLKSVFGQSLEELRTEFQETWWLSEVDYAVNYNQNALLDVTFTISGVGAYPSSYDKHRLVNLRTGQVVSAIDLFKRESFGTIAMMVNRAMQAEVQQAIVNAGENGENLQAALDNPRFQIKHLNNFSVNDQGVTFFYDFGLPHVIKALEPSSRYFFSYDQLKSYIKQDGALGFARPKAATGIRG